MIRFSFHLSPKYRLDLKLTKKRKDLDEVPFLPPLGKILRVRKGNRISRFFKHIFEHSKAKRFLGVNLAALLFASTLVPSTNFSFAIAETNTTQVPLVLTTQSGIQYPVKNIKITQEFRFYHPGIDIDGITGDAIYPIMAGKMESTEYSRFGYGNNIIVNHGNGITSLYAHLSKIEVSKDREVSKETVLGKMGATGWARGDHLHLEIRENGKALNPLTILPR